MGSFLRDGKYASGADRSSEDEKPAAAGVLAYLNGGNDLQKVSDKWSAPEK